MNRDKINAYEMPSRYDMTLYELRDLFNEATEKGTASAFYDALYTAYKYGFIRGGNHTKNTLKKEA